MFYPAKGEKTRSSFLFASQLQIPAVGLLKVFERCPHSENRDEFGKMVQDQRIGITDMLFDLRGVSPDESF